MDALNIFDDDEVKDEFNQAFNKLDRIEMIQLLSDLKYLPLKAFDDGIDSSEMEKAIQRFRGEYTDAVHHSEMSNIHQIKRSSEIIEHEEQFPYKLTNREVHVLKEITGLDKELIIYRIKEEESSLLSRVLIFRYRIYNLCERVLPNQKLTSAVIDKLQNSADKIGFTKDWLTFGNVLADQVKLSEFCIKSKVLTNKVFGDCIFVKLITQEGRKVIKNLGIKIKKKRRFLKSIASNSGKRVINDIIQHRNPEQVTRYVNTTMKQTENVFMSRVLQVKLWIMGLYQGKLDNNFGPVSIKALDDFLMTIVENQDKGKRELGKILHNLEDDQCIININYLFTKYFIPMEKSELELEQSSVSKIFDFVLQDKKKSIGSGKEMKDIEKKQNKLTSSLEKELQYESKEIIQGQRRNVRQYKAKKGIMKFFSKLFKFLENAHKELKKLFKKLFNLIKKVSKIIYNELREAFQSFSNGLKFIFGKRIIIPTESIITDYDFDFDGVTRICSKPSAEDIKIHTKTIKLYASAIYPTLNFVRIVIQWGIRLASGPIGWVKILIGIAKLFKETLNQKAKLQLT